MHRLQWLTTLVCCLHTGLLGRSCNRRNRGYGCMITSVSQDMAGTSCSVSWQYSACFGSQRAVKDPDSICTSHYTSVVLTSMTYLMAVEAGADISTQLCPRSLLEHPSGNTEVMVETFKGNTLPIQGRDQQLLAEIADYFRPDAVSSALDAAGFSIPKNRGGIYQGLFCTRYRVDGFPS